MTTCVHRIEVRPKAGASDPAGERAHADAVGAGLEATPSRIDATRVYLLEGQLSDAEVRALAADLLADPVTQEPVVGASTLRADAMVEVHPLPGVMDPDAEAIELAIEAALDRGESRPISVRTGVRYDMAGVSADEAVEVAERCFANRVIHGVSSEPYHPDSFPAGTRYELKVVDVPLTGLDDAALEKLSREAHLFLSLEEMQAIQAEYRRLGREPREIELETLAQTWSEHCVHKTLKATIRYREECDESKKLAFRGPHHDVHDDGSVTIHNLLKATVAAATEELTSEGGIDWCLSVFVDNAGVIRFDDEHAVCFKAETHNHPSAIEPYGGAATGIGGCIRDIMGTGLAAKPIAATDVFCVAPPDQWARTKTAGKKTLPAGCLHPRRILKQVVAGVRDYGNRMGIPTLNGAVWFDENYIGNPLVYCGCIGVMPIDCVKGDPKTGDRIIALGGRTGRDGIHGATFSSAELTDTHADEFSHAVQIGNPVTEKKTLDAILAARDHESGCLYNAITDCGAGGFSSAVGEMGEQLGAEVHLERAPLKYEGLSATEIWISEAQERMVLAVPADHTQALQAICDLHDVEMCDLGHFGTADRELILHYEGTEVGRLDMGFLHDGVPNSTREAVWVAPKKGEPRETSSRPCTQDALLELLAHPNIASKHWIIRQYDHEVQGRSAVKPLVGPAGVGPSDGAVITPVENSYKGLAIANGLATGLAADPYQMTLAAIDECVRNLVCVGASPDRIAILDNFCWPSCADPRNLGSLVRAAEGCYDGAMAYKTPFISGKDSLNNQFTTESGETIQIPPTLLISGFGIVDDVRNCVTMDAPGSGSILLLVGETQSALGGSHYEMLYGGADALPTVDLEAGPRIAHAVASVIATGKVQAAHDVSDGGWLCSAAEMAIAGDCGLTLDIDTTDASLLFSESASRYLLAVRKADVEVVTAALSGTTTVTRLGAFTDTGRVVFDAAGVDVLTADLRAAWRATLDW